MPRPLFCALLCSMIFMQSPCLDASKHHGWKLVWRDEFKGKKGTAPDPAKWTLETGGNGWGNNEQEYYTSRSENVHQEHGKLVITARKEDFTGADGVVRSFTSARLQTKGKFDQKYGRFEARIRIPRGQGMWPAFWMLGSDIDTAPWPQCGEIDIMENVGKEPSVVHGSMHGPGYSGQTPLTGVYALPGNVSFADGFHTFAVEWDPSAVRFFVDDHLYETQTPDAVSTKGKWVFDHPFFVMLNLAVGGWWPGNPDSSTSFPQQMLVDYVRVYKRSEH
jgi:beta-glucanase (GH16 family)